MRLPTEVENMAGASLGGRHGLAALALAAVVTASGFAVARQTPAPPQSNQEGKPVTQANPEQSPTKTKPKAKSSRSPRTRARRDPRGFYMGRQIAQVMSWEDGGIEWLFRETRIDEEQPEAMLDALKIPPGATVADVGAGAGYHSIRLARRVGPQGTVLATDVQREMLLTLRGNAQAAGVTNIKPLLATQTDTKLPKGGVDLILMVDVYHECSDPERILHGLFEALKPGGRLVLVEFRAEDPLVPIRPEHKMTVEQVRREIEPQGFVLVDRPLEFLPWQHVIIFAKPAEPAKDAKRLPPTGAKEPAPKSSNAGH
jgi:ubiquinone/menaquinone biosynthesis C-methylase UbiE